LTIFNLDKADPAGEITGVGGNGTAADPKSGYDLHGRPSQSVDAPRDDTTTLIKTMICASARTHPWYALAAAWRSVGKGTITRIIQAAPLVLTSDLIRRGQPSLWCSIVH
jgi:hypothetical protein